MDLIKEPKERQVISRRVQIGKGNTLFRIRQISDTHQDAEGFRHDLFKRFVNIQQKDKNSVWIHTGDLPDSDRPSTRHMKKLMFSDRQEAWTQEDKRNLDWLDRSIIPQYEKIADSCLGILDGDHFMVFANGMTSGKYISYKLKVPYLGERSSFVQLQFVMGNEATSHLDYVIHARHGKAGTGSMGASVNAIIRGDVGFPADLHLGGHNHLEHCHPQRIEYVSKGGLIKSKIIWYVRGGSFLDGFPCSGRKTYAYRKEYNPLPCGWGELELEIGREYLQYVGGKNIYTPWKVRMSKGSIVAG